MKKKISAGAVFLLLMVLVWFWFFKWQKKDVVSPGGEVAYNREQAVSPIPSPTPTPLLSPSPSPTPIPLPDPKIYGPCKNIPVVLYHHIQPQEQANANGQKNISVDNEIFAKQMEYLSARGYHTITPDELLSGLTSGFPSKPILLTFDDGYSDFYTYAFPVLVKYGFRATSFLSTGLVGNPDYLSWSQISEMKGSGLITFANHTWSHKNLVGADEETVRREIETAKMQLEEHGLGPVTAFAYPYGGEGKLTEKILQELGIKMAFTTVPGSYQCAKLPYDFRRSRIGNASMAVFGF